MKIWIALIVASLAVGAYAQCSCETMKWATCDGSPCTCHLMTGNGTKQVLDCTKLIPKCFLMQAEMYRARKGLSTRGIGGKPDETAFVDNDGIYDPDCENDGTFKAKQCNNTDTCWCVNSAGVRRTDKGDKDLKCEELVMTYWVRLELKHKPTSGNVDVANLKSAVADAMHKRYMNFNKDMVEEVAYDPEARLMVVDVKQPRGMRKSELTHMAYYMEKDIKALPLLRSQDPFTPTVGGQKLEFENILVYYVDEKAPTFTMKNLSGGIIAVIVVVVLAVVAGLLVLVFAKKRQGKYNKAQQRELDNM
ncbi:epithelial cell adhesion molecule [Periophthalmus magnuspinnatus]|uniref:epithelial cell adhesion molecule n=1 Tax=Periophthalmus magnuspinnatus TaxID=409849 RepID=UPI00145BC832|nr:epithelial cell adhesion molecule [Periophthalmus magnuspinnatus]